MADDLPFEITARVGERGAVIVIAWVEGERVATEKYTPGDGDRRRKVAKRWAGDGRLTNGSPVEAVAIAAALERAELETMDTVDALSQETGEPPHVIERASYADGEMMAEPAWNEEHRRTDFIVWEQASRKVNRTAEVATPEGLIVRPVMCEGIVTPGHPIPGTVYVPTECASAGVDDDRLRRDLEAFIDRYGELPPGRVHLAVEYVLLTWVYDHFCEVPYLAFRTADRGRGSSAGGPARPHEGQARAGGRESASHGHRG